MLILNKKYKFSTLPELWRFMTGAPDYPIGEKRSEADKKNALVYRVFLLRHLIERVIQPAIVEKFQGVGFFEGQGGEKISDSDLEALMAPRGLENVIESWDSDVPYVTLSTYYKPFTDNPLPKKAFAVRIHDEQKALEDLQKLHFLKFFIC
ncbi:MAG: hypothetical protein LBB07_01370 [Bifidobacteriaceae bacterium]|jgi:hypothetical protein|nr:hypothetical protein [Bifidobacteriaceae bacterium]